MFIVYINNEKHSIWNTKNEALRQKAVLKENGYKKLSIDKIETNNYENGHYFV